MKKITLVLLAFFISNTFALFDYDSSTEGLYAAYKTKSRKKKERAFLEGKKDFESKKDQLKPLQEFAEQKGDFEIFKQAVKDREKEKLSWVQKNQKLSSLISFSAGCAVIIASIFLLDKTIFDIEIDWKND